MMSRVQVRASQSAKPKRESIASRNGSNFSLRWTFTHAASPAQSLSISGLLTAAARGRRTRRPISLLELRPIRSSRKGSPARWNIQALLLLLASVVGLTWIRKRTIVVGGGRRVPESANRAWPSPTR
jgi:hypothetical protein